MFRWSKQKKRSVNVSLTSSFLWSDNLSIPELWMCFTWRCSSNEIRLTLKIIYFALTVVCSVFLSFLQSQSGKTNTYFKMILCLLWLALIWSVSILWFLLILKVVLSKHTTKSNPKWKAVHLQMCSPTFSMHLPQRKHSRENSSSLICFGLKINTEKKIML